MDPLTFVDDPAITRVLGEETLAEVRAGTQPDGDCASCGKQLGAVPLRFYVNVSPIAVMAYACHAACLPIVNEPNMLFVPDSSHKAVAVQMPFSTADGRDIVLPIVVINPETDVYLLEPDHESGRTVRPMMRYRRHGFVALHDLPVGAGVTSAPDVGCSLHEGELTVFIRENSYQVPVDPDFVAQAAAVGGFAVMIVYRVHLGDDLDPVALVEAMHDTAAPASLFCWIAVQ